MNNICLEEKNLQKELEKSLICDSKSETSSIKKKTSVENFGIFLLLVCNFTRACNSLLIKYAQKKYHDIYHTIPFLFYRAIFILFLSQIITTIKGEHILYPHEIKARLYFFLRTNLNFFGVQFNISAIWYLRVATVLIIGSLNPLLTTFLGIIILKEKFYMRYLIGVFLCIIGSSIIIFNDRKPQSKAQILNDNIFAGILFGIGNISLVSLSVVAQKALTKEGMDVDLQNYYFGLYNCVPAFIFSILLREFTLSSLKYILYVSSNGLIFYSANYLNTLSFKYIAVSKLQPISYLCIVFTFILCAILLGEPVFFSDIVGAAIIISFQYYHFINPPGRTIPSIEKESNINNENNK
jgi:drug/metabolite transporter (DMT)-like permease